MPHDQADLLAEKKIERPVKCSENELEIDMSLSKFLEQSIEIQGENNGS